MAKTYRVTAFFTPRPDFTFEGGTEALNNLVGSWSGDTGFDTVTSVRDMQWEFKTSGDAEAAAERCRAVKGVTARVDIRSI